MIHAFKFSMGSKTYSNKSEVVKTLDYVKIELYADHRGDVNTAMQDFLTSKVKLTDPIRNQLKSIHDGLVLNTHYDTAVLDIDLKNIVDHTPFEAYGLLINHKAVCSGYAKSFMGLAQELQIPVLTVSSQTMNHAWNLVYDGTQWLYVDATFDDPVPDKAGRVFETYFLISKKTITTASSTITAHVFDESGDGMLSAQDYLDFAVYLFPSTKP
jgi:transglutaminase/protease-like cytokinesis protein 3